MPINAASQPWNEMMRAMSLASKHAQEAASQQQHRRPSAGQLARARSGCDHARAALLNEIEAPCYRFCLAQLACPDAARDATQETALRVLRTLHRFRGDSAFTTWALSIALNVCREHRRRRRWLALPSGWIQADSSPSPAQQADRVEQTSHVIRLLQELPGRQREAVTLRYLQGLDTKQTAQAMRCSTGTVKTTLAKGLTRLRQQWEASDA